MCSISFLFPRFCSTSLLRHWLVSPASRLRPLAPLTITHFQSANFIHLTTAEPSLDFNTFDLSRLIPRSDLDWSFFHTKVRSTAMRPSVQLAVCALIGLAASPVALSLPMG